MGSSYLDSLHSNGIIGYDAETYINTGKQNFGSEGQINNGLDLSVAPLVAGIKPASGPATDAFVKREGTKEKTHTGFSPKLLTAVIGLTLAIGAGFKIKSVVKNKKKSATSITAEPKKGFFKRCKEKISSWFKPKNNQPTEATATTETTSKPTGKIKETASKAAKSVKEWFQKLPKGVKIGGGIVAGLIGLLGIYSIATSNKPNPEQH